MSQCASLATSSFVSPIPAFIFSCRFLESVQKTQVFYSKLPLRFLGFKSFSKPFPRQLYILPTLLAKAFFLDDGEQPDSSTWGCARKS
jgi:hypothetical protein